MAGMGFSSTVFIPLQTYLINPGYLPYIKVTVCLFDCDELKITNLWTDMVPNFSKVSYRSEKVYNYFKSG